LYFSVIIVLSSVPNRDSEYRFKPRRNEEREEKPEEIGSKPSFVHFVSSWFEYGHAIVLYMLGASSHARKVGFCKFTKFSPDALTDLEASLRFAGPETIETKIFGRLTAWQNWIF
jgi:hypothetical protein